jgi:hypothetical protein
MFIVNAISELNSIINLIIINIAIIISIILTVLLTSGRLLSLRALLITSSHSPGNHRYYQKF